MVIGSYLKAQCQTGFLEFYLVRAPIQNLVQGHLEGLLVDDADPAICLGAH